MMKFPFIMEDTTWTNDRGSPDRRMVNKFMETYKLKPMQNFWIKDTSDKRTQDYSKYTFYIDKQGCLRKVSKTPVGASNSTMWKLLTGRNVVTCKEICISKKYTCLHYYIYEGGNNG